jgi:hypothetical protein
MSERLDGEHLSFKVLEFLGSPHFLIGDKLIRLVDFSKQLLKVSDFKS